MSRSNSTSSRPEPNSSRLEPQSSRPKSIPSRSNSTSSRPEPNSSRPKSIPSRPNSTPHLYIIDDDTLMAECIASAVKDYESRHFPDAITAMAALAEDETKSRLPALIFLDILLTGPDGFTFLHELLSYPSTARIPVIIISSLDLRALDLSPYHVAQVLDKSTMTPKTIRSALHSALQTSKKAQNAD